MWEKVVFNLLSNALKFTFDGGVTLSLDDAGDHVRLTVSDTGVGIEDADLPLLFERFRRVEGVRARTHEGSGIGLALVQELARLHGGSCHVHERPRPGHQRHRHGAQGPRAPSARCACATPRRHRATRVRTPTSSRR